MTVDLAIIPPPELDEDEQVTPRLETVIDRFVRAGIAGVRVAVPGIAITAVDATTGRVRVRPVVRDVFPNTTVLPEAISNVPVYYPSGGGHSLTVPIKKDDPVVIMFCDREIRRWIAEGGAGNRDIDPSDRRRHSWSGTFVMPGLEPLRLRRAQIRSDRSRLGTSTASVEVTDAGNVRIGSSTVDLIAEVDNGIEQVGALATQTNNALTAILAYAATSAAAVPALAPANTALIAAMTPIQTAITGIGTTIGTIRARLDTIKE